MSSSHDARRRTPAIAWTVTVPAIAAWGAGLIQLALAAGAITADDSSLASRAIGVALLPLGAAAMVWGAVVLARGILPLPRVTIAASIGAILAIAGALIVDAAHTSAFAAAAAVALIIVVAASNARALRRTGPRPSGSTGGAVVGLVAGAIVVSALVTPALSSVEATRLADTPGGYQPATHDHH